MRRATASSSRAAMVRVSPLSSVHYTTSQPPLPPSAMAGALPLARRERAAAASENHSARVVHVLEGHRAPVRALEACRAASAKAVIASADDAGVVRLWLVGSWQCVGSVVVASGVCGLCALPSFGEEARGVAVLTDEGELLFAREQREGWDVAAPARPLTSGSTASSMSASHSIALVAGKLLVGSSDSKDVRVLELSGLPALDESGASIVVRGHRAPVLCLASCRSPLFASGSADGAVKIWNSIPS